MTFILVHMLLAAPLPHAARIWQCPSATQVQCLLLPDQSRSSSNCKQWRNKQTTTTELKNAQPLPISKRRNKKTDVEKQC